MITSKGNGHSYFLAVTCGLEDLELGQMVTANQDLSIIKCENQ